MVFSNLTLGPNLISQFEGNCLCRTASQGNFGALLGIIDVIDQEDG